MLRKVVLFNALLKVFWKFESLGRVILSSTQCFKPVSQTGASVSVCVWSFYYSGKHLSFKLWNTLSEVHVRIRSTAAWCSLSQNIGLHCLKRFGLKLNLQTRSTLTTLNCLPGNTEGKCALIRLEESWLLTNSRFIQRKVNLSLLPQFWKKKKEKTAIKILAISYLFLRRCGITARCLSPFTTPH